jgi:phospholipid transport system substrate-binding protein
VRFVPKGAVFGALLAGVLLLVPVTIRNLGSVVGYAAVPETPLSNVQSVLNQATDILRTRGISVEQRRAQLRALAEQHLDFPAMARSALGAHWETLSNSQRHDYVPLFTAFIEDAYLNRIQEYLDLKFKYVGETMKGLDHAQVETYVVQTNAETTSLNFELELKGGVEWKVYDVEIDTISMVGNYRAQFNRVIKDRGFDALLSELRQKQRELEHLLGQRRESRQ